MNATPADAPPLQEFFILGNPRSGTSLLRNILNAHPSVCVPPECGFLLWLAPRFTNATWDDATKATFIDEVMCSKKFETWELPRTDLEAVIMPARIGSYAEAASRVYVAYARSRKRTISTWGDKNNYYIQHIPAIRALFPDARYIHIVRDVRDVACSYLELGRSTSGSDYYPDLSTDVEQAATEWEANNALIEHEARGNASNYLLLRYEDLVHSFRSTIGTVFNFLGVGTPEGFNERDRKSVV